MKLPLSLNSRSDEFSLQLMLKVIRPGNLLTLTAATWNVSLSMTNEQLLVSMVSGLHRHVSFGTELDTKESQSCPKSEWKRIKLKFDPNTAKLNYDEQEAIYRDHLLPIGNDKPIGLTIGKLEGN